MKKIKMQKTTLANQKRVEYKPLNQSYVAREKLYHTKKWFFARKKHLESNPICVKCGAEANTVDHSKMHHIGEDEYGKTWEDYFWDSRYYQSMCSSCHSQKTTTEDMKNKPKRLTESEKRRLLANL